MLVHPWPMCPRPKILGCCIPWTMCPLANLPLTEPSHPLDLSERSDTRLPTAARFSAAKRWSSMCGPSVHLTEGRQSNKPGQGRRGSRPDAPLIHRRRRPTEAAIAADGARSRVGTQRSGTQYPRDALFKGRNIQELSVGDTSVGDTSTLHQLDVRFGRCVPWTMHPWTLRPWLMCPDSSTYRQLYFLPLYNCSVFHSTAMHCPSANTSLYMYAIQRRAVRKEFPQITNNLRT